MSLNDGYYYIPAGEFSLAGKAGNIAFGYADDVFSSFTAISGCLSIALMRGALQAPLTFGIRAL